MPKNADYGLDAPGVVRNLLVAAAAGLTLFAEDAGSRVAAIFLALVTMGSLRPATLVVTR